MDNNGSYKHIKCHFGNVKFSIFKVQRLIFNVALLFVLALSFTFLSCSSGDDENELPDTKSAKTVFLYMPWTGDGSDNLYKAFQQNISDIKSAIVAENGLSDRNLLIFISQSSTKGVLIRVKYQKGQCIDDTIRTYDNTTQTNLVLNTDHWITYIMNQVASYAPANIYSLIIGSHGYGWIDASNLKKSSSAKAMFPAEGQYFLDGSPITRVSRSFGGQTILTDISTLATGIAASNIKKFQYILFDDCNMSNVETAYALKSVTDYLIGCPTEIMAYGMPYTKIWNYLADVSPDYNKICDEFYNFYNNYNPDQYNCGTIGVTDCSQVDSIASLMKQINAKYTFNTELTNSIQNLDGYNPPIFFDMGDYVSHLCSDTTLLATFEKQLKLLVPYKSNTEYYYSSLYRPGRHLISTYSGITISDPSTNSLAAGKTSTAFYTATH